MVMRQESLRAPRFIVLCVGLCVVMVMAACGGGGSEPSPDTNAGPLISTPQVDYAHGSSKAVFGDTVTVTASVTDPDGVSSVALEITPPSGVTDPGDIAMIDQGSNSYAASFSVYNSSNVDDDELGVEQTYSVRVVAVDAAGKSSSRITSLSVEPAAAPPMLAAP